MPTYQSPWILIREPCRHCSSAWKTAASCVDKRKTDYRRVLFFLTQRGQKLQDEAIVMEQEIVKMLNFTDADLKAIGTVMAKINPNGKFTD